MKLRKSQVFGHLHAISPFRQFLLNHDAAEHTTVDGNWLIRKSPVREELHKVGPWSISLSMSGCALDAGRRTFDAGQRELDAKLSTFSAGPCRAARLL